MGLEGLNLNIKDTKTGKLYNEKIEGNLQYNNQINNNTNMSFKTYANQSSNIELETVNLLASNNNTSLTGKELVDQFWYAMFNGTQSDKDVLTAAYWSFYEEIVYNNNKEAEKFLKKVIEMKNNKPEFHFEQSYWSFGGYALTMWEEYYDQGESYKMTTTTLFHELGHLVFNYKENRKLPNNFDDAIKSAKEYVSAKTIEKVVEDRITHSNESYAKAEERFDFEIKSLGYDSADAWKKDYEGAIEKSLKEKGRKKTIKLLEEYDFNQGVMENGMYKGVDKNFYNILSKKDFTAQEVAQELYDYRVSEYRIEDYEINYAADDYLGDIIDAVYMGEWTTSSGYTKGHGKAYYTWLKENYGADVAKQYAFDEMIADFTYLKVARKKDELDTIKNIFGEKFYNMLEETYNNLYNK